MLNKLNAEKIGPIVVCFVCLAAFFVNNRMITPDIMESRNIITAREMVYEGHWLVPTMNGGVRLEKPPLPTWLTAVAEILSPDNLALQRGMAGLAALLLVFYFWKFARHVLHLEPLIPTLLLCTCYNVILMGRTASWDIYCHAFMMGGIYHLARALGVSQPGAWWHFLAAGVFTGLSILSKGPVSLYALFLPFLISYGCTYHPTIKGKGLAVVTMAVVAIVVGTVVCVCTLGGGRSPFGGGTERVGFMDEPQRASVVVLLEVLLGDRRMVVTPAHFHVSAACRQATP